MHAADELEPSMGAWFGWHNNGLRAITATITTTRRTTLDTVYDASIEARCVLNSTRRAYESANQDSHVFRRSRE